MLFFLILLFIPAVVCGPHASSRENFAIRESRWAKAALRNRRRRYLQPRSQTKTKYKKKKIVCRSDEDVFKESKKTMPRNPRP